jgi:Kef-type K+ transport system membrane component KefB
VPAKQLLTAFAAAALFNCRVYVCRHGRATFSVLLFQDLAVVVLLMLIPLLAPDPSGASTGMAKIAKVGFCIFAGDSS